MNKHRELFPPKPLSATSQSTTRSNKHSGRGKVLDTCYHLPSVPNSNRLHPHGSEDALCNRNQSPPPCVVYVCAARKRLSKPAASVFLRSQHCSWTTNKAHYTAASWFCSDIFPISHTTMYRYNSPIFHLSRNSMTYVTSY